MSGYDLTGNASSLADRLDITYEEAENILRTVGNDLLDREFERGWDD